MRQNVLGDTCTLYKKEAFEIHVYRLQLNWHVSVSPITYLKNCSEAVSVTVGPSSVTFGATATVVLTMPETVETVTFTADKIVVCRSAFPSEAYLVTTQASVFQVLSQEAHGSVEKNEWMK